MKIQVFLVLAVFACAFGNDVGIEEGSVENKVEVESKENESNIDEDEGSESSKDNEVLIEDPKENKDKDGVQDGQEGPMVMEWTAVYGKYSADTPISPFGLNWPDTWVGLLQAIHPQGLRITSYDPEYFYEENGFYP